MDPTKTVVGATEWTRDAGRRDGWTDGRTEWNQYTPEQLRCAAGITTVMFSKWYNTAETRQKSEAHQQTKANNQLGLLHKQDHNHNHTLNINTVIWHSENYKIKELSYPEVWPHIKTRSTPRAQTSATPSSKSVKQSSQAWNSVAYCFLCTYPENFMNVHPSGITWCCQQTRTQKIEKRTLCPRG